MDTEEIILAIKCNNCRREDTGSCRTCNHNFSNFIPKEVEL